MIDYKPLTAEIIDDLGTVLRGNFGAGCWCMFPRMTEKDTLELPGDGPVSARRKIAMSLLAGRERAPGLLAYEGDEPVGWIAVAPRHELGRIARSRAAPPVDDVPVWVIPCVTVAKAYRGRGIAVSLIKAAVAYADEQGAPAVEAYPRADDERTGDDNVYFGTETMFRRAGFEVVREPLPDRPRNWLPRPAMRISTKRASH